MNERRSPLTYALITPARNERRYIERVIESVVAQTVRPSRWIIVSDGSTDGTDEIVATCAARHPWIDLLRMPEHRDRSFAAKATCFNAAYERLKSSEFDVIGNLDADITLPSDYYEFLLGKFAANAQLGVAGTPFVDHDAEPESHTYAHRFADLDHVSGAAQTFRKTCFEQVGGYVPIKGGGIDWVAVTTARMKGWQTRTFVERTCTHHRKMGTAGRGPLAARFRHGREDYYVGGHPVWQILRGVFQMKNPPFVVGGLCVIAGYFWAMTTRAERPVSAEVVAFHRSEQMARLRKVFRGK